MKTTISRICQNSHVSVELIRHLLGLNQPQPRRGLSIASVRALTGASSKFIQLARDSPKKLAKRGCICRYCPRDDLTTEEIEYFCSETTLRSWRTFSLLQRTKLFSIRFPRRKLSIDKLRKVYHKNHIKLRSLKFTQKLTETQIKRQTQAKREVLPKIIRLME